MSDSYGSKRRRRDSDDGDFKRQRVPPSIELARRLTRDITEIGERPVVTQVMDGIESASRPIASELPTDPKLRQTILAVLYAVICEQPHKMNYVAVLIRVSHARNSAVGRYVVEYFHSRLQTLVDSSILTTNTDPLGNWTRVKAILRFLCLLGPILESNCLCNVFKQLLDTATALKTETATDGNKRCPLAELLWYIVVVNLPYLVIGAEASTESDVEIVRKTAMADANTIWTAALNSNVADVADKAVTRGTPLIEPFQGAPEDIPYTPESVLLLTRQSVAELIEHNWEGIEFVPTYGSDIRRMIAEISVADSETAMSVRLPQLSLPQIKSFSDFAELKTAGPADALWATPPIHWQIYLPVDFDTVPQINTYASVLLRDIAAHVTVALEFNRKEAARQLLTLDLFFVPGFFAPPGISIDKLKELLETEKMAEEKSEEKSEEMTESPRKSRKISSWKIEDIVIESVLGLLFNLPKAVQPPIYYMALLVECCEKASQAIAPVFGRAIRFLYRNLPVLDFELAHRFLDWFSLQLCNFGFTWKWKEWEAEIAELMKRSGVAAPHHPKLVFARELVAKEVALSSETEIRGSLQLVPLLHPLLDVRLLNGEAEAAYDAEVYGSLLGIQKGGKDGNEANGENSEDEEEVDVVEAPGESESGAAGPNGGLSGAAAGISALQPNSVVAQAGASLLQVMQEHAGGDNLLVAVRNVRDAVRDGFLKNGTIGTEAEAEAETDDTNGINKSTKIERAVLDLFVQLLCCAGSRSLSHADDLVGIYKSNLQHLTAACGSEGPAAVISAVMRFWNVRPFVGAAIVQMLVNRGVLSASEYAEWLVAHKAHLVVSTGYGYDYLMRSFDDLVEEGKAGKEGKEGKEGEEDEVSEVKMEVEDETGSGENSGKGGEDSGNGGEDSGKTGEDSGIKKSPKDAILEIISSLILRAEKAKKIWESEAEAETENVENPEDDMNWTTYRYVKLVQVILRRYGDELIAWGLTEQLESFLDSSVSDEGIRLAVKDDVELLRTLNVK